MSVCPEWDSQEIFGRKVDEPPKNRVGFSSPRARPKTGKPKARELGLLPMTWTDMRKSMGWQRSQAFKYFVPGSRRQEHAIHPEVKSTPIFEKNLDVNLIAYSRHKDVRRRDRYARGTVYKLYSYVRV